MFPLLGGLVMVVLRRRGLPAERLLVVVALYASSIYHNSLGKLSMSVNGD